MLRKAKLFLIMLLLVVIVLPRPAYAVTDSAEPELTICCQYDQENLVGVQFELYKVADLAGNGEFRVTSRFPDFENSVKDITNPSKLAAELEYYALEFALVPDATCTTGQDGIAKLPEAGNSLERGLYLVLGRRHVQDGYIYEMNPMLVSFPRYDESTKEFTYQCDIKPKFDRDTMPEGGEISRKVLKIWLDKGYENQRPKQIVVKLLRNREVYDTVILNKDNHWSYTWEGLSADAEWTVVEARIPNYKPSLTLEGITFKLTNEFNPPPGPPTEPPSEPPQPPPNLPQTGQLWWPVPVMFLLGIVFVAIGILRRREECYED